jgi:formylglycine-generating enzyme required for sulfatase activity
MMQTAIDKLRELRTLHEDGLLTRAEFDSRKNAILDAAYAAAPADASGAETPAGDVSPADQPGADLPGADTGGVAAADAAAAPRAPTAPPARAGTEIGLMSTQEVGPPNRRYRLERLIAQGGMGQVWQATDLATQAELGHSAQVALKILPPQLTENSLHARLLVEEAARARQLAHQHIVRVYDWAEDPATGSYFVIMEYLDGEDLDTLLARVGRLDLDRALAILDPLADALEHAWARHRLVHRDIKPANVFITRAGDVKLLDFGIAARARAGAAEMGAEAGAVQGLEVPATSGTAGYRAPEAAGSAGAPGRGLDVYASAVMLYRMLAGRLPFGARRAAVDAAPARPDGLTPAQWDVLQAGFARDAGARPASVRELLARLRAAQAPSAAELHARAQSQVDAHQNAQPQTQMQAGPPLQPPLQAPDQGGQAAAQRRIEQQARELALRKLAQARAEAAAKSALAAQRREQEKLAKAAAEQAREVRKEALRRQLAERRAEEAEKAQAEKAQAEKAQDEKIRLAREDGERKQAQARAAAAYLAQQKGAQAGPAVRPEAEAVQTPPAPAGPAADLEGVLRDHFSVGDGRGPELVLLPTGRFQMGSPDHERKIAMDAGSQQAWLARELPQHWVGIERPVAMARTPVTVGEWREFVRVTGWQRDGEVDWDAPGFAQTDRHPVVGVNWYDAVRYARWLSEATGRTYRLPSEAEWEYACRAGTRTAFSFGDTISTDQANYDGNFTYNGGPRGEYRRGTTPVGMFPANPWGLFDMHGNVWEWVQDVVHDNYDGAPLDGSAWETGGDQGRRILRGGSWLYNPRYLRAALRNGFSAALSNDIVGFRVVRELM